MWTGTSKTASRSWRSAACRPRRPCSGCPGSAVRRARDVVVGHDQLLLRCQRSARRPVVDRALRSRRRFRAIARRCRGRRRRRPIRRGSRRAVSAVSASSDDAAGEAGGAGELVDPLRARSSAGRRRRAPRGAARRAARARQSAIRASTSAIGLALAERRAASRRAISRRGRHGLARLGPRDVRLASAMTSSSARADRRQSVGDPAAALPARRGRARAARLRRARRDSQPRPRSAVKRRVRRAARGGRSTARRRRRTRCRR